jgi:broad specificity phosphatase PhoE
MTLLAVLRHGPTEWSAARRLQGRRDVPLSPAGRETVSSWRLPAALAGCSWLTSPLGRAVETAEILGLAARREARLIEMAWGEWEGLSLAELAAHPEAALAERAAAGLDFRPPGGESPREVQARLTPLLAEIARGRGAVGAVTHKGVIRALFALASGWDMLGRAPVRLDWQSAHLFRLDAAGAPTVETLNLRLGPQQHAS